MIRVIARAHVAEFGEPHSPASAVVIFATADGFTAALLDGDEQFAGETLAEALTALAKDMLRKSQPAADARVALEDLVAEVARG